MAQRTFIFIGRSGCGKGTQAALLKQAIESKDPEKRPIFYLETGERFRQFVKGEKYSNQLSNEIYKSGERQPDFLAVWNWSSVLVDVMDNKHHLIVDGMPRSHNEALVFDTAINFYKLNRPTIIYIDVSRKWSMTRLQGRGRSDDQDDESIKKRLDWFDKDVYPAVQFFKSHPGYHFVRVDGEQTIGQVHKDIMAQMNW